MIQQQGIHRMLSVKKYTRLLLSVGLFLHSVSAIGGEITYGVTPLDATEGTTTLTSEVMVNAKAFMNNAIEFSRTLDRSIVLPVAGLAVVTGLLILGRKQISEFTVNRCNDIDKMVTDKYESVMTEAGSNLEAFEKASFKNWCLIRALRTSLCGLEYIKYNQWYMSVAAVVGALGKIVGHPYYGGCLSTAFLLRGWQTQDFSRVYEKLDTTNRKLDALTQQNETLHAKSREKLNEVKKSVDALSGQLEGVQGEIQGQLKSVQIKVSDDINVVGEKLAELGGKLQHVPEQILAMEKELHDASKDLASIKGSNAKIIEQNRAIVQKIEKLSQQLTTATEQFVLIKKEFDTLGANLIQQVKKLAEDTTKQISKLEDLTGKQTNQIEDLKSNMESRFENLVTGVTNNNKLLQSFENIQKFNGLTLNELNERVKTSEKNGEQISESVIKLLESQEASAFNYAKIVTNLDQICKSHNQSFEQINENISSLDAKHEQLEKEVVLMKKTMQENEEKREKSQQALHNKIDGNQGQLLEKVKIYADQHETKSKKLKAQLKAQANVTHQMSISILQLQTSIGELKAQLEKQSAIAVDTNKLVRETHNIAQQVQVRPLIDSVAFDNSSACEPIYLGMKKGAVVPPTSGTPTEQELQRMGYSSLTWYQ